MNVCARMACGVVATALLGVAAATPAQASHYDNAVVHWNEVATNATQADSITRTPSAAALYVGIAQAAVYNATMAIEQTHGLYRSSLTAPPGASVDAAVAAAAHDVLVEYFGDGAFADHGGSSQQAALDGAYAAALAEIPEGEAKNAGISVGGAAAAEMIALRAGDGRFATVPAPPEGDQPGEWKRTAGPSAVTPWTAQVRPFLVNSPDQFRPEGPNALTSEDYAERWDEVRRYGVKDELKSARSPQQTEIAFFWTDNTVSQYNRAFRGWATERGLSEGGAARLFAMAALTAADGVITCWNTKYHHLFWRPITAIREADSDGNPATTADPSWVPLSTTANHPEYTSGHACLTGAVSRALAAFVGSPEIDLTMDAVIPGRSDRPVRDYESVTELRREVENARIYGGDHFRVGGSDGTKAGDHVAKWALKRYFQPR